VNELDGRIERLEELVADLRERNDQQDILLAVLFLAVRPPQMQDTPAGENKFRQALNGVEPIRYWRTGTCIYPVCVGDPDDD